MEVLLGAVAALGLQLLLVVVYIGILLTLKHLLITVIHRRTGDRDHSRPSRE